jgi:hypothetical protein
LGVHKHPLAALVPQHCDGGRLGAGPGGRRHREQRRAGVHVGRRRQPGGQVERGVGVGERRELGGVERAAAADPDDSRERHLRVLRRERPHRLGRRLPADRRAHVDNEAAVRQRGEQRLGEPEAQHRRIGDQQDRPVGGPHAGGAQLVGREAARARPGDAARGADERPDGW